MAKLSDKQRQFCNEYLADMNATQAAVRAGYSEKTARQQAQRMLTKVDIQERIQQLQAERSERCKITADEVVERLRSITEMWESNPSAAVRALELLGKHLGIFERDNQQSRDIQIELVQYGNGKPWKKTVESTEKSPKLTEYLTECEVNES